MQIQVKKLTAIQHPPFMSVVIDKGKTHALFSIHDHDKDGEIDLVQLVDILREMNVFYTTGLDIMTRFGKNGRMTFEEFWIGLWTTYKEEEEENEDLERTSQDKEDKERFRSGSIIFQGKVLHLSSDDEY